MARGAVPGSKMLPLGDCTGFRAVTSPREFPDALNNMLPQTSGVGEISSFHRVVEVELRR